MRKGGREETGKMNDRKVQLRMGSLNIGIMTGRGRTPTNMMERRKIDLLRVWKTQ